MTDAIGEGPTPERLLKGDIDRLDQQIVDVRGSIGRPYRTIDLLTRMEVRGDITPEQRQFGEDFRVLFHRAALDSLRSADMIRDRGSGFRSITVEELAKAVSEGDNLKVRRWGHPTGSENARLEVFQTIEALGGITSLEGSVVWHVLGLDYGFREWAQFECSHGRQMDHRKASRLLARALSMLGLLVCRARKGRSAKPRAERHSAFAKLVR